MALTVSGGSLFTSFCSSQPQSIILPLNSNEEWYFAYGSNMNVVRMNIRNITFSQRYCAALPNYQLIFNKHAHEQEKKPGCIGYANIRESVSDCVFGCLYSVLNEPGEGLARLDLFEGVDHQQYYRQLVTVYLPNGSTVQATTYIGFEEACYNDGSVPTIDYIQHILGGADVLPAEYVALIQQLPTQANPDVQTLICGSSETVLLHSHAVKKVLLSCNITLDDEVMTVIQTSFHQASIQVCQVNAEIVNVDGRLAALVPFISSLSASEKSKLLLLSIEVSDSENGISSCGMLHWFPQCMEGSWSTVAVGAESQSLSQQIREGIQSACHQMTKSSSLSSNAASTI